MMRVVLASLIVSSFALGAAAQSAAQTAGTPVAALRVVVAGNPPFVVAPDGVDPAGFGGIGVEIWRAVAADQQLAYELLRVASVAEAIDQVESGRADVAVGPISITADRARRVAFTQPYYESALGIVANREGTSVWSRLAPFASLAFLGGAAILLGVLMAVGLALWVAERGRNPQFPARPIRGIGEGLWLAIVTMTTVGYGDRVPTTARGRVIAAVWMLVSMLTVSSLTAFLATALTVATLDEGTISSAEDLAGRPVAVLSGTTGVDFARRYGARLVETDDVQSALLRVADGDAVAAVHDRPILLYALQQSQAEGLIVAGPAYEPQSYGLAHAHASPLGPRIDASLLSLAEVGELDRIVSRWIGDL